MEHKGLDVGFLRTSAGYSTVSEGIWNKNNMSQGEETATQLRRLRAFRERDI